MGVGKVFYVDVIADGAAIGRFKIRAVERAMGALSEERFNERGDEMSFRIVALADL